MKNRSLEREIKSEKATDTHTHARTHTRNTHAQKTKADVATEAEW